MCFEDGERDDLFAEEDWTEDAAPLASAGKYLGTQYGRLCMNVKCDVESMTNGSSTAITVRDRSSEKVWG